MKYETLSIQWYILYTIKLSSFAGVSKKDAQLLFIREVYETEFYGMLYVPSIMHDGQNVVLAVGAKYVRIYNSRWTCIKK